MLLLPKSFGIDAQAALTIGTLDRKRARVFFKSSERVTACNDIHKLL
jgi:hypothetical protein